MNMLNMNMHELNKAPNDSRHYVKLPSGDPAPDWIASLRGLIAQGADIEIEACRFQTMEELEETLIECRYRVMFLPLPNETAFARFFLDGCRTTI